MSDQVRDQTIRDFGRQWTAYADNEGFYGSAELLKDILEPLLPIGRLKGTTVAEIGAGAGRVVLMMLQLKADAPKAIYAIEPSKAVNTLRANVSPFNHGHIKIFNIRGDELPPLDLDFVLSIGAVHHIPDPDPVMKAAYNSLKPGGQVLLWLYGREGNEVFLSIFGPLRQITSRLPHWLLVPFAHTLNLAGNAYLLLARALPVPMRDYVVNVYGNFTLRKRYLVVYDQLNPAYARYYTRDEAVDLLQRAGFEDVQAFHRHGYSWTVRGTRPSV